MLVYRDTHWMVPEDPTCGGAPRAPDAHQRAYAAFSATQATVRALQRDLHDIMRCAKHTSDDDVAALQVRCCARAGRGGCGGPVPPPCPHAACIRLSPACTHCLVCGGFAWACVAVGGVWGAAFASCAVCL
jgi:hypothetical protein